jgi:hypothetical protein
MAFTEAERVKIRLWMGYVYAVDYPSRDALITRILSVADGGLMPDSSTETLARSILTELDDLETQRKGLRATADAGDVDELRTDAPRGGLYLRQEGRILVKRLARLLGDTPLYDAFGPGQW